MRQGIVGIECGELSCVKLAAVLAQRLARACSSPLGVYALVAAIAVASIALRWPFLEVPLITDEGAYAYVARFWSSDFQPYRDIPLDRPQGLFVLYWVPELFGGGARTIRLFGALYNAATVISIYWCGRHLSRRRTGVWAAAFFAVVSAAPWIEGFTCNAELFTLLPITLSASFAWRRSWLVAGLTAGAAAIIKPSGGAAGLLVLLWLVHERPPTRQVIYAIAGMVLLPAACLVHGALVDWGGYWNTFVERRLLGYSVVTESAGGQLSRLLAGIRETYSSWMPLAAVGLIGLMRCQPAMRHFLLVWIVTSGAGMALGGMWHAHYFQQLIPVLAVCAAAAMTADQPRLPHVSARLMLVVGVVIFLVREAPFWLLAPKEVSALRYQRPGYLIADSLAEVIATRTDASDTLYVAFAEAEIYYLANRKAAVQELFWRDVESSPDAFQQIVESLRRAEPAMVVVVQSPPPKYMSRREFLALLEVRYELIASGPLALYQRRPDH